MTVKMDSAGRIVLPKSVRESFDLSAGSELNLSEKEDQIVLTPVEPKSRLVKREGWWVITGIPSRDIDWLRLVTDDREERMRHILGGE
jgi:AbrB family looped-hinge helix DNA binding protein